MSFYVAKNFEDRKLGGGSTAKALGFRSKLESPLLLSGEFETFQASVSPFVKEAYCTFPTQLRAPPPTDITL